MILVDPAVLTEEESAMGFEVTDAEFNARYRPWLGRTDLAAQEGFGGAGKAAGGDAGQLEADHADPAADTAGAEWLGDSSKAIDARVYGGGA